MGAERPRNDKIFTRSAEQNRVGGEIGEAPPAADEASRFRGSAPIGGCDSGRESAGTTVGKRAPPLRIICGRLQRATARVAPTGGQGVRDGGPMWASAPTERSKGAVERADVGIGPYGAQQRGGGAGRCGHRPLRSAARGRWNGSSRTPTPTERSKGAVERVVEDADPYGAQQGGGGAGRRGRRPLRGAARGQWSGSSRTPTPTDA